MRYVSPPSYPRLRRKTRLPVADEMRAKEKYLSPFKRKNKGFSRASVNLTTKLPISWGKFIRISLLVVLTFFLPNQLAIGVSDTTPPITTSKLTGTMGNNGWYTSAVNVNLWVDDLELGTKQTEYWLDSNAPSVASYQTSANIISNPSFEVNEGGSANLKNWSKVISNGATLSQGSDSAKFGTYSAKIVSTTSGWASFDTSSPNFSLNNGVTYTITGWVKLSNVVGNGAEIRIITAQGGSIIAQTFGVSGTSDWQRLEFTFSPPASANYVAEVGLDGTGTVWWDGINLYQGASSAEVSFNVASDGTHQANYFSTNNSGLAENTQTTGQFKIDTAPPTNWRDLNTSDGGNAHSLEISVTVDDLTSGIDQNSAFFQYRVNSSQAYGYYSNLGNCNSTWNTGGWLPITSVESNNNFHTVTLETPIIDFCNSNWGEGEAIKFKIKDMAGNEVTEELPLIASWLSTQNGDVHSNGGIDFTSVGYTSNSQYVISSTISPIINFTSAKNWLVAPYNTLSSLPYQYFLSKGGTNIPTLPGNQLPTQNGFYVDSSTCNNNGSADYTISSSNVPSNYDNIKNLAGVILICGNLTINTDFTLDQSSALIFAVKGDIKISKQADNISGFFFADGQINSSFDGNSGNSLNVYGGLSATGGFNFKTRSLKEKLNATNPAELIVFQPGYFVNKGLLTLLVGTGNYVWQEVAP